MLLCRRRIRNVQRVKTHVRRYYSAYLILYFATSPSPSPSWLKVPKRTLDENKYGVHVLNRENSYEALRQVTHDLKTALGSRLEQTLYLKMFLYISYFWLKLLRAFYFGCRYLEKKNSGFNRENYLAGYI